MKMKVKEKKNYLNQFSIIFQQNLKIILKLKIFLTLNIEYYENIYYIFKLILIKFIMSFIVFNLISFKIIKEINFKNYIKINN